MTKQEALSQAKLIGLRAVEDALKDIAMPMLAKYVADGNATAKMIYLAVKAPLDAIIDKVDGEEG